MQTNKLIEGLVLLGDCMVKWGENREQKDFPSIVQEGIYEEMLAAMHQAEIHNKWFTPTSIRTSFLNFGKELTEENLKNWMAEYKPVNQPKSVGLILASNLPIVGFHDVISTLLSGNKAAVKLSRDDRFLIPILLKVVALVYPEVNAQIEFVEQLKSAEAVIATGSDNSSLYFEKYFGHLPHIIRKNRTSLAILTGEESEEELRNLAKDIFTYFGMGCRNVTHLILPEGFDLSRLFAAFYDFKEVINHYKYGNNYDYYKAIYLMNQEVITENGFILLRETKDLFAPIAVLHYHFYKDEIQVEDYLQEHKEKIQVVVGKKYAAFGSTQVPLLEEYADGVDTMAFLCKL